jgi:hypothetical protein
VQAIWKIGLAALLVGGGIIAALRFADTSGPYTGTWKVTLLQPGVEKTVCLLRVGGDEAKPTAEVIDSPGFATAEAEDVRIEDGALRFRLKTERGTFQAIVRAPKGETSPRRLLGSLRDQAAYDMVRLERTDLQELDPKKATGKLPGFDELGKAVEAGSPKEKEDGVREILKKYADEPVAQIALGALLQLQIQAGSAPEELKSTAERYMAAAAAYGREIELQSAVRLARGLGQLPPARGNALAVECGRRAEKLLTKDDPPALAVNVFRSLAAALRSGGNDRDAKEMDGRAAEVNAKLDAEFAKNAVPFHPTKPAGRRSGSDRVVLAELFTGARCPPCVGADVAFDAALQVYKPSQVVFLQYHEHIPGSDPLTSLASEARLHYYDKEVRGTPSFLLDGKILDEPIGGTAQRGEESYSLLHTALDKAMEAPAEARLKLTARRTGDAIELGADVTDLRRPGQQTRLRFVLTEEVVHYAAPNGQRLHHHVVRDFPGGIEGFTLTEKIAKQTVRVDLGKVRKELGGYLAIVGNRQPFPDDDRPLELQQLKAVAFIQDDLTKQVLQAAQVDLPEGK